MVSIPAYTQENTEHIIKKTRKKRWRDIEEQNIIILVKSTWKENEFNSTFENHAIFRKA